MQKINFDKQSIVFFSLAIFLIIGLVFLLPSRIKKISDLNNEIAIVKRRLNTIEREWLNKDNYLNQKQQLKAQIEGKYAKFILPHQESKVLSFISETSKKFGIEIKSFSQDPLKSYISGELGEYQYLPITIKAKSKFHNLAMFLGYLQNSQYFFDVKSLNIKSDYPYNSVDIVLCAVVEKK